MTRWSCVLFDLDGTLADSAPGVIASVEAAFAVAGLTPPPRSELTSWLGPPMIDNLTQRAGLRAEPAQRVLRAYRAHYDSVGLRDTTLYPGALPVLSRLRDDGVPMGIASSKPDGPARDVLAHLGVADFFVAVCGALPASGRATKADSIRDAITEMGRAGTDVSRPVLIGDRHHDIAGARERGIDAIYAEWGYGDPGEAAGAVASVARPESLLEILLPG